MLSDIGDNKILDIKYNFKKLRQILNVSIIAFLALGVTYLIYSVLALADSVFLEHSEKIFLPLAKLITHSSASPQMFMTTGFTLLALVFPALFLYALFDNIESNMIKEEYEKIEHKKRQRALMAKVQYNRQFEEINSYSICLSLDYDKEIEPPKKLAFNSVIYAKIKSHITKIMPYIDITEYNGVFIIKSNNFVQYDFILDSLLNSLSKVKKQIEQKFSMKLIPSITTDAYLTDKTPVAISKNHFDIQSCNCKNRAMTTAAFAKKYTYLNQKKYKGIPIGEFALMNSDATYDLNVVYKNLSNQLDTMGV